MSPPRLPAAMASHLPRFPFRLVFVFLAFHVHVPASHGKPLISTFDPSMCQQGSFWCGGVDIHYPFYLPNTTKKIDDYTYSCGYTDLEVSCQDKGPTGTPVIRLGGDNYTIRNISYDSRTIILADSDVAVLGDGGGGCPVVRHNVSFDEVWLYNASSFDNITLFFGCYSGDTASPQFDDYKIDCPGFSNLSGTGGGVSFVFKPEYLEKQVEDDLARHCDRIISVPVQSEILNKSNQSMLTRGYGSVLTEGFELAWRWTNSNMDACHVCDRPGAGGGRCAYSQSREFLGCLCNDGKVHNTSCTDSAPAPAPSSKSFQN